VTIPQLVCFLGSSIKLFRVVVVVVAAAAAVVVVVVVVVVDDDDVDFVVVVNREFLLSYVLLRNLWYLNFKIC
jgi:hypothetical protein